MQAVNDRLHTYITTNHGIETWPMLKKYKNYIEKKAKTKARLVFLLKCRRFEICPRFIMDKVLSYMSTYESLGEQTARSAQRLSTNMKQSTLNMEIGACNKQLGDMEAAMNELYGQINECVQSSQLQMEFDIHYKERLSSHNMGLYEKFERLKLEQPFLGDISFDESFIKNLTDVTIPKPVLLILSLGPKFSIQPDKFPVLDIITDLEYIISRFAEGPIKKAIRGQLAYTVTRHTKSTPKLNRIDRFLKRSVRKTKQFLKANPEIFVSTSDKGSVTIVSKKADYVSKLKELVQDEEQFKRLGRDPTSTRQNKNNALAKSLFDNNFIDIADKKKLTTYTAVTPRLFGQIKYHKEGNPVRPIVSTINSPSYNLSRYLATILKKAFSKPKFNIKSSTHFLKKYRRTRLTVGHKLVSFDVVNCFSNIPVDLALELIERDFSKVATQTDIPKKQFMELLSFCMKECNYFCFEGSFYQQSKGMFMGSSLSPILVERVIEEALVKGINTSGILADFWSIYVDDVLTSIPAHSIQLMLTHLNAYHPDVQFTIEIEDNGMISYLDMQISNRNGMMVTNWYHKTIASNRMLNFYSSHPEYTILNTAKSFIKRVLQLSHRSFHAANLVRIRNILGKNSFPSKVIDKLIHQVRGQNGNTSIMPNRSYPFLESTINTVNITQAPMETKSFCSIPYVPGLSKVLNKEVQYFIPDVKLANKPSSKLSELYCDMKQKLHKLDNSGCVYSIPCKDCSAQYIGETIQKLRMRVSQHKSSVNPTSQTAAKKENPTALVIHSRENSHQFDFERTGILYKNRNKKKLQIQEVHHIIANEETSCNFKSDSDHIGPTYYNLIKSTNSCIRRRNGHRNDIAFDVH